MTNYKEEFTRYITILKIGLILFFLTITVIYQLKFHGIQAANTFFGNQGTTGKVIGDSVIAGLLGVVTVMVIVTMRNSFSEIKNHIKTCVVIFIILFLFNLSQESSGLNRYMAEDETAEGKGPYAELDGTTTEEGRQRFKQNREGNYFLTALAYTCAVLVFMLFVYLLVMMGKMSYQGYKTGENSITHNSVNSAFGHNTHLLFIIELILIVGLNGLMPYISTRIRNEDFNRSRVIFMFCLCLFLAMLHVMFQYSGMLKFADVGKNNIQNFSY